MADYTFGQATVRVLALLACLGAALDVSAQGLPTAPISIADGLVVIGAELTGTVAPQDPGYFNFTDYEFNGLRNIRLGVSTEIRPSARLQFLAEVRVDGADQVRPYALFARIRPWPARRFDIQAGRVPPTFGAMGRSAYGNSNLLIGQPLAYQYLTSLRADAVPTTADDLLRMRARGWRSSFGLGDAAEAPGLPIVNTSRWDTGVQIHGVAGRVEWTGALTTGSLSDPRVDDNNGRPQVAGRAVVQATAGARIGASVARGPWLDDALDATLATALVTGTPLRVRAFAQTAVGVDAEYSIGRFLARGEVLRSAWQLPTPVDLAADNTVAAHSVLVEGRYRLGPGVAVAMRTDHLLFSDVQGVERRAGWDADVHRFEAGLDWSPARNVILKGAWQQNRRADGRVRKESLVTTRLVYWF